MNFRILILALSALTACSTNPSATSAGSEKVAQTDDPSKGIICKYEQPTGSFLREKKCTTPEQREAARLQNDTLMDTRREVDLGR